MRQKCLHPPAVSHTPQVVDVWRIVGLLSGTSMDGIDVSVSDLWLDGDTLHLRPLGHDELTFPPTLRDRLAGALPPAELTAHDLCVLDTEMGQEFAAAATHAIDTLGGGRADVVASLGQTLYHWVEDGQVRGTLQIGQPAWIAEATNLPVIADLRARDVAAGGHGAPLAAVIDTLWLADDATPEHPRIALNIGGIANITVVGGPRPLAYDTGPGNALLDLAASRVTGGVATHDIDGATAARGSVRADLLDLLLDDDYFAAPPPKSTGKEHFNAALLDRALAGLTVDDTDLLATLTELTAVTIAEACRSHRPRDVLVSGGGGANPTLMAALRRRLGESGVMLSTSDTLGLPTSSKEAHLTALIGFLTWVGLPGNVPSSTGATGPRTLGTIVPGGRPLAVPEPAAQPVRRLRVHTDDSHADHDHQEAPCNQSTS